MRTLAALLTFTALLAGCSERERANPFDPNNPNTGGRPAGFVAVAGSGFVQLRWLASANVALTGYYLVRKAEGDSVFRVLVNRLSPTARTYTDFNVTNGRRYDYRLFYVIDFDVSPIAAEDFATPGPLRPWVSESGGGQVLQIAPDGRHVVLGETGFQVPGPIAVGPDGRLWVGDTYTGNLSILGFGGRINAVGLLRPVAIAVDPRDHSAWVCDESLDEVGHFLPTGERAVPPRLGPFQLALAVAVDPVDGSVWVCDNGARQVHVFDADGFRRRAVDVPRPSRIAIHEGTRDAWVTSFEGGVVMRLSADGAELETFSGFGGPIGIAVDADRQRIWVADAVAGQVIALRENGTVERAVAGYIEVREVAVDPHTGNAWALVPRLRRVSVISPAGAEVAALSGLRAPVGIAIDPGR